VEIIDERTIGDGDWTEEEAAPIGVIVNESSGLEGGEGEEPSQGSNFSELLGSSFSSAREGGEEGMDVGGEEFEAGVSQEEVAEETSSSPK
jgi:hypothetical protein